MLRIEGLEKMIELYRKVILKDGRAATVVETLGTDYIVDVGTSPADWETIVVKESEIEKVL